MRENGGGGKLLIARHEGKGWRHTQSHILEEKGPSSYGIQMGQK